MVIGLQIGKLHGGGAEWGPPAVPDSKKPGLFRVKSGKLSLGNSLLQCEANVTIIHT